MHKTLINNLFAIGVLLFSGNVAYTQDDMNGFHPSESHRSGYVKILPKQADKSSLDYQNAPAIPAYYYRIYRTDTSRNANLDSIVKLLQKLYVNTTVHFDHVWIGGSASPDGSRALNERLAAQRAQSLSGFLLENSPVKEHQIEIENLGEDWFSFKHLLMANPFKDSERILHIIDTESDLDERERAIKAIDGGKTWHKIVSEILPLIRNTRVLIVCREDEIAHPGNLPSNSTYIASPISAPAINAPVVPTARDRARWFIAAKTNALFLAATVANLGIEIGWDKWSVDLPVYYSPYNVKSTRKLRLLAIQPEVRRWLGHAGEGHFFGLHGHVAGFNVAINDNGRYQDPNRPLWGVGLGYGYALSFGKWKHWGLEFNIGIGYAHYDYDVYYNRHNGLKFDSGSGSYWGITRAGITLTYKWWMPGKKKGGRR